MTTKADPYKALGHPIRRQILQRLQAQEEAPAPKSSLSPNQLAGLTGVGLSTIAYHVRVLRTCEAVKLTGTKPRRGATEHFYRLTPWMGHVQSVVAEVMSDD